MSCVHRFGRGLRGEALPAHDPDVTELDVPGAVRRIRRAADMSQRELATACGVSQSSVARLESGRGDALIGLFARMAAVAGLRVALVDADGEEQLPMSPESVRDAGGRLFPAHLDTRHGDDDWWAGEHRPRLRMPRYTYDRDRRRRDRRRDFDGSPDDHHRPQAGDGLAERAEARRRAADRKRAEDRQRKFLDGSLGRLPDPFTCACPAECDYDEERNPDLRHAPTCPCACDVS